MASRAHWSVFLLALLFALVAPSVAMAEEDVEYPLAVNSEMEDVEMPEEEEGMDEDDDEEEDTDEDEDNDEDDDDDDEDLAEEDEDEDEDDEEDDAPSRLAAKRAAKKARLTRMYKVLNRKYKSLRKEIAGRVRAVMWRKYAWLRLLHARRRWYLINRRYRRLVSKFRDLPSKQFLVRAWKRYTHSAEYRLHENRRLFKVSANRAKKYLRNLNSWVAVQKAKIRSLRANVRRFLRNHGKAMTKQQRENMRLTVRSKLRAERSRLAGIVQYWKTRIESGDLPLPKKKQLTRAQELAKGTPKTVPAPRPMVAPLHVKLASAAAKVPSDEKMLAGEGKWIRALLKRSPVPKRSVGSEVTKAIAKASKTVAKPKRVVSRGKNDWFAPLRERYASRSARRSVRRVRREQRRLNQLGGKATLRRKRGGRSGGDNSDGKSLRKWKNTIRQSFRNAWNTKKE